MLLYLFLLFTIVPLVELALLIRIGHLTEWWVPIAFVILTGIAGAALARWQGLRALSRIREELRAGRMPADAIMDGVLILVGAILLVTPGVLTDVVALALLLPPVRRLVKRGARAWLRRHVEVKTAEFASAVQAARSQAGAAPNGDQIIDAKVINTHVEEVK